MNNLIHFACCVVILQFSVAATLAAPLDQVVPVSSAGIDNPTAPPAPPENLTVLDDIVDGIRPEAMMPHYLTAHAKASYQQWRTTYEAINTPEQGVAYQQKIRRLFLEHLGGLPERTPLAARVTGRIGGKGYRIEKILHESRPKHFVSANLYLPDSAELVPPYPGVLVVCGHAKEAKGYEAYAKVAALCALNGMVALVIDPIEQGERIQWIDEEGKARIGWGTYGHTIIGISAALLGQNTARFEVWDAMRGIDYLQSRPEVDRDRIGVTGNSGGGTQTSHIMALDPRVVAAAPSCYLTSFERLLDTIGPQDAEQCIHGQLAWGMDHADFILMRAPRPTLIAANTQDFFDITGTWNTFRYAKRFYTRLGASDRVDLCEVDAKHGFQKLSREAAVRFFVQHLRGELHNVSEPEDLKVPGEKELWATPDGNVMRLPDARSVYDLMAEDLARLTTERPELTPEVIRQMAGFPALDAIPMPDMKEIGTLERAHCKITKLVFHLRRTNDGQKRPPLFLPALLFTPLADPEIADPDTPAADPADAEEGNAGNAILYIHASGKTHDAAPNGPIEALVRKGRTLLAVDVRGIGETLDPQRTFYHDDFGRAGKEYMTAYLLGKTYVGMRAEDILVAAKWLKGRTDVANQKIDLVACGNVGVPALHAAVAEPSLFERVRIERVLDSWASLIEQRAHKRQLVNMVHGVLAAYDLPDLRAALGDRLTVISPLDALEQPIEIQQQAPKPDPKTGQDTISVPPTHSPYDVAYSPDGDMLAVSDRTAGELTLIDPIEGKVIRHVTLRGEPTGLQWSADGKLVYVAEYNASSVAVVDPTNGKIIRRLEVGLRPIGLAIAPRADLLLAANNATQTVSVIDLKRGQPKAQINVSREPFAIAVTPDESLAVVSNLLPQGRATDPGHAAVVSLIDLKRLQLADTIQLPTGSSSVRDVAISADGKWAYLVHTVGRTNLPTTQVERGWINTNGLSILDLDRRELYATLLLDHPQEGAADPWGLALANDGSHLHVSISGGHQLARIELATLHTFLAGQLPDNHRLAQRQQYASGSESIWLQIKHDPSQRAELVNDLAALHGADLITKTRTGGKGPRGIALSPDGKTLATALYYTGVLILANASDGKMTGTVPLGDSHQEDLVRLGESIFHDATKCFQQWMSCASCHPNNARVDGLNWDLLNDGIGNPKNNKSLLQAFQTSPMMWRGVREDFSHAVEKGFYFQMRQPEPGEVEAVLAYLRSLKPESSPFLDPDGKRTAAAERGKVIFESNSTQCSDCHTGSLLTDQSLHNVGTQGALDKSAIFDTPSLIEIYRTSPYLHDGSSATLLELLTDGNRKDAHGKTSHLSGQQTEDLIEYLKSL